MSLKLNILFFLLSLFIFRNSFADEKFLKIKGTVVHEESNEPIIDYTVKVVQDRLDSNSTEFTKSSFSVWLPANRRSKVYFVKEGFVVKHIYVDASAIPSIAYKKKQQIEIVVKMIEKENAKSDFSKPFLVAKYRARDNGFYIEEMIGEMAAKKIDENYVPPFPAPVDTYKAVKPTVNNLILTENFNRNKAKLSNLSKVIQGVLFADMNYCLFNERTNKANEFLHELKLINQSIWGNIKAFDSPEYGRIVMRTVNREQSVDTLFALGAFIESSRLIFLNFTSDSKVLVHLKILKKVLVEYHGENLSSESKEFLNQVKELVPKITDIEKKYTQSLKDKMNFEMAEDDIFIEIKAVNLSIYEKLIE